MKKLKAIISMIVIVLLLGGAIFSVVYFAQDEEDKKIVVTNFPIYDICREILGSDEDIMLLQDTGADMHSYKPTASVILAMSRANTFIHIGGESDKWVDEVIKSSDNESLSRLCLMDYVDKLEESADGIIESGHAHSHEHRHDGEHSDDCYDEHIWLSLRNMIKMTEVIADELVEVYPDEEVKIRDNTYNYIARLQELDQRYAEACSQKNTTIVVADRFPFLYLAHDYGISFMGAFSGCSSDAIASFSLISKVIDKINEEELNFICELENSKQSIADSVISNRRCREGVEVLIIDSVQSVTRKKLSSTTYLEIMENNLNVLKVALNNENN
jgi:zinc transport system substrate-binding protein